MPKQFTVQDAYDLGLADGHEAVKLGQVLSSGMTWPLDQDFNEAYDKGVNDAQAAAVLAVYPEAYACKVYESLWRVYPQAGEESIASGNAEYEAWQNASTLPEVTKKANNL